MKVAVDQADRDRARRSLDLNVVVEAGAGTGKTTLLTDRLAFLLLGGKRPIESVVALTFTEKAAAEIKIRLAERLTDAATGKAEGLLAELGEHFGVPAEEAAALARKALEGMDRAQIGTIHSFASHLLRLFPVEAGVDPGVTVDEGQLFEELFESHWAAWLDDELGEKPPRPGPWLEVLKLAPLEDLEALARELCSEKLDLDAAGGPDRDAADWLETCADTLEAVAAAQTKPKGNSKIGERLASVCARLRSAAADARSDDPDLPAELPGEELKESAWPKGWDPDAQPLYESSHRVAKRLAPGGEALVRRSIRLLRPFAERLRAAYARRGLISFDGLLRRARDLVRDRPEVRERLKARFSALLIDEFQDTDPLQGELLLLLAEAPGRCAFGWEKAKLGPGRLFVVGDPKQSIYRFRGADISAYQRFTERIMESGGAFSCTLKANFRSAPEIIEPVNAVFGELMRPEAGLQPAYAPLQSGRDAAGAIQLVAVGPDSSGESSAARIQRAEAAWICRWLLDHCGEGKPHRFRDVAILLRSSAPLGPLLEAFKAWGVPYAVEMEKQFFGAPEIIDVLNLLRALCDPSDGIALAGLLRSPLAALPDAVLYKLGRDGDLDYRRRPALAGEDGRKVEALYRTLRELSGLVGRRPAGEIVAEALRRVPLPPVAAKAYHGQQTVSNLAKLSRLAAEASDQRGLTLREFIAFVQRQIEDRRAEGESPLADEHLEAVRVLTIHKSKGLEFPVAILSNAGALRGGNSADRRALLDWSTGRAGFRLPKAGACSATLAWLDEQEKAREERETLRLLYVALTRAKSRMIVVGAHDFESSSLAARLAQASAWPRLDSNAEALTLGGRQALVTRLACDGDPLAGAVRPAPPGRPAAMPAPAALGAAWKRRLEALRLGAGKKWTKAPTDAVHEAPKGPRMEEGGGPAGEAALVGMVCHRVLEAWDFRAGGDAGASCARAAGSLERLEPGADWAAVRAEALGILEPFLRSETAKELGRCEIVAREAPFIYAEGDCVVRGAIDLVFRRGGKLFVADYKTARLAAGAPPDASRYAAQAAAYRAAVEKAFGACGGFALVFLRRPELGIHFIDSHGPIT